MCVQAMNSGLKALSHRGCVAFYSAHPFFEGFIAYEDAPADAHDGNGRQVRDLAIDEIRDMSLRASKFFGGFSESENRRHDETLATEKMGRSANSCPKDSGHGVHVVYYV